MFSKIGSWIWCFSAVLVMGYEVRVLANQPTPDNISLAAMYVANFIWSLVNYHCWMSKNDQ